MVTKQKRIYLRVTKGDKLLINNEMTKDILLINTFLCTKFGEYKVRSLRQDEIEAKCWEDAVSSIPHIPNKDAYGLDVMT